MNRLRKLYYSIFPTFKETDNQFVSYLTADKLMLENSDWKLSKEEDNNHILGWVYICKKTRIRR